MWRACARNTIYKLIFILSIAFTAIVMVTGGIKNGEGNTVYSTMVTYSTF